MRIFKGRKEKGITLIALIVTIIVLIILATVSINTIFGEDGIIARAELAREENRAAVVKEEIEMWKLNKALADHTDEEAAKSAEELLSELVSKGLLTEEEKTEILANGEITIGSQTVELESSSDSDTNPDPEPDTGTTKTLVAMFNAAQTAGCTGGDACTDPENHLHIGDYVNYENPASGSVTVAGTVTGVQDGVDDEYESFSGLKAEDINQSYTLVNSSTNPETNKNNVGWRVMGIDSTTGGIKLIADTVLQKDVETSTETGLYVYGAKAYTNVLTTTDEGTGEKTLGYLDSICSMYANTKYGSGTVARSVTAEDINEMLGVGETEIATYDMWGPQFGNTYGSSYSFTSTADTTHWTPEEWEAAYADGTVTDAEKPTGISGTVNGYGYEVVTTETEGKFLTSNVKYDIITCSEFSYWVASHGVIAVNSSGAVFGPGAGGWDSGFVGVMGWDAVGAFTSNGEEVGGALFVCPVVCLESGVKADAISVIATDLIELVKSSV